MVEMLGVLALVGVLSVAAIAGYSYAITKWKANETLSEIGQRAMEESLFLMKPSTNPVLGMQLPETDFGPMSSLGYAVQAFVSDVNADYFEIVLQNIPSNVCAQLVRDDEISIGVFVGETAVNGDPAFCGTEETTPEMSFVFRADLSRFNNCSEKGYFDLTDLSCHCSGNTYIDSETNECLCPAGHVWSEDEKTCIESICDEGEFETFKSGCVPCSDPAVHNIANSDSQKKLCEACGRTVVEKAGGTICSPELCEKGVTFLNGNGSCVSCTTDTGYGIGFDENSANLCNACEGREIVKGYYAYLYCIKSTMCDKGSEFIYDNAASSGHLECRSCSVQNNYTGQNAVFKEYCEACGNRTYWGGSYPTCVKSTCDAGEFLGLDGKCYLCTHSAKIQVSDNSGCADTSCGREVVNGYCQIKNCQTSDGSHVEVDGNCYPCAGSEKWYGTKAQCEQCMNPKRLWLGTYVDETTKGTCMVNCELGKQVPYTSGGNCYSCSGYHDGWYTVGSTQTAKDYCESCDNNYYIPSYCIRKTACVKGQQFRRSQPVNYKICVSCDLVESVKIGTTAEHREMCASCASKKRFWTGEYCYRCDTDETPDVTTEAEKSSCTACTERTLSADGKKCILKQ